MGEKHSTTEPLVEAKYPWQRTASAPVFAVLACWLVAIPAVVLLFKDAEFFMVRTGVAHVDPPWAPLRTAMENAASTIAWTSIAGAFAGTILLRTPWRPAAAYVGLGSLLAAHLWILPSLINTEIGPERVERYIGENRYVVPWHRQPIGSGKTTSTAGFRFVACPNSQPKPLPFGCSVSAYSDSTGGLENELSVKQFLTRQVSYMREPAPFGYERYHHALHEKGTSVSFEIFVLRNNDGRITRFVRCDGAPEVSLCRHSLTKEDFRLEYTTYKQGIGYWKHREERLLALIRSWRTDGTSPQ